VSSPVPETVGTNRGPSVEGASAELLSRLLSDFELELRGQGVAVDEFLRPGASERDIRAAFDECDLIAPLEAIAWFGWRDGPTRTPQSHLVMPMFMGWSLAECVRAYRDPRGQPKGSEPWQWDPNWLQIMGDANGLAIYCSTKETDAPLVRSLSWGREFGTQPAQTLHQVVSLCTPVAWWIDALRNGWYRWNPAASAWEDVDHSQQPRIRALRALS
jgi:hypothetical protein